MQCGVTSSGMLFILIFTKIGQLVSRTSMTLTETRDVRTYRQGQFVKCPIKGLFHRNPKKM
jgi:hypothetical protein